MGSRSGVGLGAAATLKRKEETNSNEYFFAKFWISPEVMLANEFLGGVIDISLDRRYPFSPPILMVDS